MGDLELMGAEAVINYIQSRIERIGEVVIEAIETAEGVLEEEADRLAPKQGVMTSKIVRKTNRRVVMDMGPNKDNWTLRFFETGATAHEISGAPLIFQGASGELIKAYLVNHPGAPARPFLRPALDGKAGEAMEAAGRVIWEALARE